MKKILDEKINKEKIYVDKDGYEKMQEELQELKNKYLKNSLEKGEAYDGAAGDGWHDNFAFDEANRQEHMLLGQIKELEERLINTIIVDSNKQQDESIIDINSKVLLSMNYGDDDIEELKIKLIASTPNQSIQELTEVSINSPLGKAIYGKHIGEKAEYSVNNINIKVEILKKINDKVLIKK